MGAYVIGPMAMYLVVSVINTNIPVFQACGNVECYTKWRKPAPKSYSFSKVTRDNMALCNSCKSVRRQYGMLRITQDSREL